MADDIPHDEEVVRLADAPTAQEAHAWRQALEADGIYCRVVGDYLDASFGSLNTIPAELWVRRPDLERARAVLQSFREAEMLEEDRPEDQRDDDI